MSMMSLNTDQFAPGDWIVHPLYGVGQLEAIETKKISGETSAYFKIQMPDSVMWVQVERVNGEWARPLAAPGEFEQALAALQRPPRAMSCNFNGRKQQITDVRENGNPVAVARLVRDLWARQAESTLSNTEKNALRYFVNHFLAEWCVCMKIEMEEARRQLFELLSHTSGQRTLH